MRNREKYDKIRAFMGEPTNDLTFLAVAVGFSNEDVAIGYLFAAFVTLVDIEDRSSRELACGEVALVFDVLCAKAIEGA